MELGTLLSNDDKWILPTFDLDVPTPVIIINLEDAPATTVWGEPFRAIESLTNWSKKIVYMGLRKNLGEFPELDQYFTTEMIELDNGDRVQVLQPSPTSEVLFQTSEGKVWGLRDGNLWIISNQNWHTLSTISVIDEIGLNDQPTEEPPVWNGGNISESTTKPSAKPSVVEMDRESAQKLTTLSTAGAGHLRLAGVTYEIKTAANDVSEVLPEPISIVMAYDQSGVDEELLGIYYLNDINGKWEYVRGEVDKEQRQFTFLAERAGIYSVMEFGRTFDDLPSGHWAERAVKVLAAKHIVNGVDERHFAPTGETTRAEFAALLIRALGLKAQQCPIALQV